MEHVAASDRVKVLAKDVDLANGIHHEVSNDLQHYNSPLATVFSWGVLDIFKKGCKVLLAVWRHEPSQKVKWLFELMLVIIPFIIQYYQPLIMAILGVFVLILDMKLCYNQSSISLKIGSGFHSHCCMCMEHVAASDRVKVLAKDVDLANGIHHEVSNDLQHYNSPLQSLRSSFTRS